METDVLVTFSWLQHAIERCIGYQNGPFDEALHTLAGQSPDDTSVRQVEIGCMVSIYSLIIRDYLPSPELRGSIYQMLYSLDGNSLTDHILKSLNTTDSQLLHDQLERIQ